MFWPATTDVCLWVGQLGITVDARYDHTHTHTGTVDPAVEANVKAKLAVLIARRGGELEALLRARDSENTGEIPVKAFSECLRAWDAAAGRGGGGGNGDGQNRLRGEPEGLTHADRKVLYRRWAVKKRVRYDEFLRENGYHEQPSPSYSKVSKAIAADITAAGSGTTGAATPARLARSGKRSSSSTSAARSTLGRGGMEDAPDRGTRDKEEGGGEERALLARAKVVFVRLSKVSSR